jgi:dTDP-4-dehydrorhamnose 3,5-epimerase
MGEKIISNNIEGVIITPLQIFKDDRGSVFKMINSDEKTFDSFGENYISMCNPGVLKGWKYHYKVNQNMVCPIGNFEMVIYDSREASPTYRNIQKINFGENNYLRITLPPKIWYSFKNRGTSSAYIVNCVNLPHSPDESIVEPIVSKIIPFNWDEDTFE